MEFGDDQTKIEGLGAKNEFLPFFNFLGHEWVNVYQIWYKDSEMHPLEGH